MAIINGIWDYEQDVVFNSRWFNRWQSPLLFLLNNKSYRIRETVRDSLCIYQDPKLLISKITPNSVHFAENYRDNQREAIFYSYGRNRNRIIIAGHAIWNKIHNWDIRFANRFAPALNLGFDTLTQYSTIADGNVRLSDATWATVYSAMTGSVASSADTSYGTGAGSAYYVGGNYWIVRGFFYYDTSSIGSGTISAAVKSIYGVTNNGSSCTVQKGTQADTLATSDFDSFSGSSYAVATPWSKTAYNDFTLNSTGISDINKSGTTKYCTRENSKDYGNSAPSNATSVNGCYYADQTGNSNDPKLVVTYTTGSGFIPKIIFID